MSFEDGPQQGKATLLPLPLTPAEKHAALAARVARMKQCLARVYVPYSSLQRGLLRARNVHRDPRP